MAQISKAVRRAVFLRLSDAATGFNAALAGVAASYGVTPFVIDWTVNSKQFFAAQLHPDEIDESTPSKYPMVMLYALSSDNRNIQKFAEFAGFVSIGLDIHLSWRPAKAVPNFEDLADAVEDAVYATLNGQNFQDWGASVVYNGDVSVQRRPLEMSAENWRQTLSFRLVFEVVTN
ncbi:hypothetical protein UFOVP130_41 [uncultured Caudovirales phage]|uniref:Uncharacterized protein n=1 Tax=uncultured Caudovirales phage TaxID=2100421 RepID=A0A6J5LCJ0_9CAUD|nr:hypothetical protein UFOVP130_41 [uncultured Caudovirales phage]